MFAYFQVSSDKINNGKGEKIIFCLFYCLLCFEVGIACTLTDQIRYGVWMRTFRCVYCTIKTNFPNKHLLQALMKSSTCQRAQKSYTSVHHWNKANSIQACFATNRQKCLFAVSCRRWLHFLLCLCFVPFIICNYVQQGSFWQCRNFGLLKCRQKKVFLSFQFWKQNKFR